MSKLTDTELSLAVALVLQPQYKWRSDKRGCAVRFVNRVTMGPKKVPFSYTTDDALGKMCVWYVKNSEYGGEIRWLIDEDNPHRAIAEAIVEISK